MQSTAEREVAIVARSRDRQVSVGREAEQPKQEASAASAMAKKTSLCPSVRRSGSAAVRSRRTVDGGPEWSSFAAYDLSAVDDIGIFRQRALAVDRIGEPAARKVLKPGEADKTPAALGTCWCAA
ncbi:hypothetical protein HPB50_018623 [Hyalomma asiaticum]|uniref:Uncharacterized protein n=1 Tax=Hyalomma asiaticum TaxID=266040 RepID=A0ACB7SG79_HYAAI|nr:hypothetical protein HPB50_018623 [Hyalomma asiaticum]